MPTFEGPQHLLRKLVDLDYSRSLYTDHRSPEIFGRAKSRAWEEAWDAALPLAQTWVLASVAAWQWGWRLALPSVSE